MAGSTAKLYYRLHSVNPYDRFEGVPAWHGSLGRWQCLLDRGRLEATATEPFADISAARTALEPLLRDWEASAFLRDLYQISFLFEGAQLQPSGRGSLVEAWSEDWSTAAVDEGQIYRRENLEYPAPNEAFTRTPLVADLIETIESFRRAEARLPAIAHEFLANLEATALSAGMTVDAMFNVDPRILQTLAELARRGHPPPEDGHPPAAYRGPEWQWMQEVLLRLATQAGLAGSGPPAHRLVMEELRTVL